MVGEVICTLFSYDSTPRHILYSEDGLEPGKIYRCKGDDYFIISNKISATHGLNPITKYATGILLEYIRVFESDVEIKHDKVRNIRGNRYEVESLNKVSITEDDDKVEIVDTIILGMK